MGDPKISLDFFHHLRDAVTYHANAWGMDKSAMKQRHVFFQEEDRDSYVRQMLTAFAPA